MNSVLIAGWLASNPKNKVMDSGVSVTRFTLRVRRRRKTQDGREFDTYYCSSFGNTADRIYTYCCQHSYVMINGYLDTDVYQSGGELSYITRIVATDVDILKTTVNEGDRL